LYFKNSLNRFEESLKDIAVALKSFGNLLIDLQNALQSFRTHISTSISYFRVSEAKYRFQMAISDFQKPNIDLKFALHHFKWPNIDFNFAFQTFRSQISISNGHFTVSECKYRFEICIARDLIMSYGLC